MSSSIVFEFGFGGCALRLRVPRRARRRALQPRVILRVRSVVGPRFVLLLVACASLSSAGPLVLTPKGGKGSGLLVRICVAGVLLSLAARSLRILLASVSTVSPTHTHCCSVPPASEVFPLPLPGTSFVRVPRDGARRSYLPACAQACLEADHPGPGAY